MEASPCCICLKLAPLLFKITEKAYDYEIIAPFHKLLICVPDINWLQNYKICNLCKDNLDEIYDFREMCFKSEFLRCEIKIEDHKVEILDNDGFGNDLKIETKPPLENTTLSNVCCNICSNIAENLSKISKNSNEENLSPIFKLKILIENIIWSDDYDICNLCKERLNKAYDFRDLCFKNQCNDDSLAIESKQIKIETSIENGNECNILRELLENNCTYCECIFDSKQQLIVHLRSVHPTKLKRSKQSNIRNMFKCKHCNRELKSKRLFQLHLVREHKIRIRDTLKHECLKHEEDLRAVYLTACDFKCEQCGKEFKTKSYLQRHLSVMHKVGVEKTLKHGCHLCSKRFSLSCEVPRHVRLVHLNICDLKCEQCSKEFKTKQLLDRHLSVIHKVGVEETLKHECHLCSKRFSLPSEIQRHVRLVHLNICDFKCELCRKEFKTKQLLRRHLSTIHKVGVEATLKHECHLCSKRFSVPNLLKTHLRLVHLNICDFKCEQCNKQFKSKQSLQRHLATVHKVGVKEILKYVCDLCSKRFSLPNQLKTHLRQIHLNIYDFKCEQCNKEFKSNKPLQKHLARVHNVGVEKALRHECHLCSKRFQFPNILRKHMREVHLNISDFKCEQCGDELKSKYSLHRHTAKIHDLEETAVRHSS